MNNLRLLLAFSSIIVFFGCVENEIERYEVQISVEPQSCASISPENIWSTVPWRQSIDHHYPCRWFCF